MFKRCKFISIFVLLLNFLFLNQDLFSQTYYNRGSFFNRGYNYNYNYNNYYRQNSQQVTSTNSVAKAPLDVSQLEKGKFYVFRFSTAGIFASSSEYRLMLPDNPDDMGSPGLLIYLHGDGANDYYQHWIVNQLVPIAKQHNLILVSVLAPGTVKRWYVAPRLKAEYLSKLIEVDLFSKFDIDSNHIYFTGSSGGSQFLTGIFIAEYASSFSGGAFPTCGGANIYKTYQVTPKITQNMKKHFKLFYYTTSGDFLYPQVQNSKLTYQQLGLKVGFFHPAGGHCQFQMKDAAQKAFKFFYDQEAAQTKTQENK